MSSYGLADAAQLHIYLYNDTYYLQDSLNDTLNRIGNGVSTRNGNLVIMSFCKPDCLLQIRSFYTIESAIGKKRKAVCQITIQDYI